MRLVTTCAIGALAVVLASIGLAFADAELPSVLEKAINQKMPDVNFTPAFDSHNFADKIDNPYYPLKPGTTMKYAGTKDGQPTTEDFHITPDHKMIVGVNAMVIHDRMWESGKLVEETYDWFAQDKAGNVWYFGEATKALDKGKWTTEGSWQAGVVGARPGIYMEAHPKIGDTYMQEFYQGHSGDSASVLSLAEPISVPYGSYTSAQLTMEWSPDDPGGIDAKYYVSGVGVVKELAATGATEVMSLQKIVSN